MLGPGSCTVVTTTQLRCRCLSLGLSSQSHAPAALGWHETWWETEAGLQSPRGQRQRLCGSEAGSPVRADADQSFPPVPGSFAAWAVLFVLVFTVEKTVHRRRHRMWVSRCL